MVILLTVALALVVGAESSSGVPQLRVAGCAITVDLNATYNCLTSAFARQKREAEELLDKTKKGLQSELKKLQSDLKEAQDDLAAAKKDLENARKTAETEAGRIRTKAGAIPDTVVKTAVGLKSEWEAEISRTLATHAPLFDCLRKEPGFDFVALSNAFTRNPGQFAETQVRQSMAAVRSRWATVMKAELAEIASGRIAPRQAASYAASAEKLARLAEPVPGARCVFTHAAPLVQPHVAAILRDTVPLIEKELRAILTEQILPQVQKGIAAQLREVFKQALAGAGSELGSQVPFLKGLTLSEEELRGIVRKVLLDRRFAQLDKLLPAVERIVKLATDTQSTPTARAEARDAVLAAIGKTTDWDRLYLQIGAEAVRTIGHKYLDSDEPGHGGFLLNHGVSLLQIAAGGKELIAEGLCGLIPEVGAAACAYIQAAILVAWNELAVPGIEAVAAALVHHGWDEAMDRVRKQVDSGRPIADLAAKTGLTPIDAFIGSLPHESALKLWAVGATRADQERLDHIFASIGKLATAAMR